ncbi:glucose-1-phosphate adenylyltransferase family protein [Desulfopila sp. IMCC35008]|uniref:glucose-1-phosphate adenylyltransferase family protein n=1 Tax=Desulfopila sp. IMCC35008 TaxID=2653858 RepID=UPI0013D738DE|nr:glucose-1-phosphate adenylyltransferase family protein [Desulfopila sp. IMCC35008]
MPKSTTLAMVLAGGRVDELDVLTYGRPKSALPFGGFGRVIDFPLSNLMNSGIEQVAILSQYRSYSLINHIGTGAAWDMLGRNRGVSILPPYIGSDHKDWYRGSADAIHKNLDFIQYHDPEHILILSGDHIYRMDYREMLQYHKEKDADLTMGFVKVGKQRAHRFGVGAIDTEDGATGGRLTQYWEKPDDPQSDWASLTVLCFKPEVLYNMLEQNQQESSFEFGRNIVPALMAGGYRLYGYKFYGYWGYTKTVDEYWQSNMDLLGENPKIDLEEWGFRTNLDHRNIRDFQPTIIGDYGAVENSLIYNGCHVEGKVRNSILFPGVKIGKNSKVENSVLFFNNEVGRNCRLSKVVADVNNSYGEGVIIGAETGRQAGKVSVVGWNNQIPGQTVIGEGATIWPELKSSNWKKVVETGEVLK